MASNKRKILDAARKYAQKGAKDKALKEYHTLLKLDPRDAKLHLEIGDCYRRWGQIDEAITQYSRVAEQYKADGFDARAVAVFKQILNLDPKRYTAYVSLSDLYQRMGLDSEALSMLQAAADAHHKEGKKREALELLRRMASLDPTNTTSRLKVAELLRQEGLESDAVAEYELVVNELVRQGALESVISVEERILEVKPERVDVVLSMGRHFVELGQAERALPLAKRVLENDPEETDAHGLLLEVYRVLGREEELVAATRLLAKIFRDRGDEGRARELSQRISASALDSEEGTPGGIDSSESEYFHEDDLLDDDFLAPDTPEEVPAQEPAEIELELDEGCEELLLEDDESEIEIDFAQEEFVPVSLGEKAGTVPAESDCDQLLAEATVYLRYGKSDQAIVSLEAILDHEPEHRMALEKLGDAHAEAGRHEGAVEAWCRAAARARAEGDEENFSALRDRVSELDAKAGGALADIEVGSVVDEEFERSAVNASEFEIGEEADLELQPSARPPAEELALEPRDGEAGDAAFDADEDGEEIDFEVEIELDDDDVPVSPELGAEAAAPSSGAGSTTTSQQVAEDLEEAEFYREHELFDEAEAIYRRVLVVAPNHPSALLRLGELAAERGGDPSSVAAEEVGEEVLAPDVPHAEAPRVVPGQDAPELAEFQADDGEAREIVSGELAAGDPACAEDTLSLEEDLDESNGAPLEEVNAGELSASLSDGAGFDLAAELRGVIEDSDATSANSGVLSTVGDGLESIFADFKQAVSATLSEDDYETRYGLGIAYREMELYDDAIGEFRMCLDSPSHKLTSLHMMGLCALDLGRARDAASHFQQVLSTPDLPAEQLGGLRFDLGRAFEAEQNFDGARGAYESVLAVAPDFPGVMERLQSLADSEGAGASREDLGDPGFESFDDLITEAESVLGRGQEDGAASDRPERRARPRKKKISFV